jgi:hypothetical protein
VVLEIVQESFKGKSVRLSAVCLGGASTRSGAGSGRWLVIRVAAWVQAKMVNCREGGHWLSIGLADSKKSNNSERVLRTQFDSFNCEAKLAKKAQYSNPLIRIAVYYM